jgi:hypothetical protein
MTQLGAIRSSDGEFVRPSPESISAAGALKPAQLPDDLTPDLTNSPVPGRVPHLDHHVDRGLLRRFSGRRGGPPGHDEGVPRGRVLRRGPIQAAGAGVRAAPAGARRPGKAQISTLR